MRGAGERAGVAEKIGVHAGHDAQQRAFARAVGAEHADLGAGIEREIDPLEDLLAGGHDLAEVAHGEDVFAGHRAAKITALTQSTQRAPRGERPRLCVRIGRPS